MLWVKQKTAPKRRNWPGAEASPESESGARRNGGTPGTWEALQPPTELVMGRSRKTVLACCGVPPVARSEESARGRYSQAKETKCGGKGCRESEQSVVAMKAGN